MVTVIVTLLIIAAIIYMFNAVGDWFVHNWYYVLGAVILVMVVYGQIINDWPIFDAISDLLYSIREKSSKVTVNVRLHKESTPDQVISRLIQEDHALTVKGAKCPACGAYAKHGMTNCEYCGTRLEYKIEVNKEGDDH